MSDAPPPISVSRRGLMLVISSPSGAGKSTLARNLLANDGAITMSVSVTTRPAREGEVDGEDYHFISDILGITPRTPEDGIRRSLGDE